MRPDKFRRGARQRDTRLIPALWGSMPAVTAGSDGSASIGDITIKWGIVTSTIDGDQVFSFPVPFDTDCYQAVLTSATPEGTTEIGVPFALKAVSSTGFTVDRDNNVTGSIGLRYIAIGS